MSREKANIHTWHRGRYCYVGEREREREILVEAVETSRIRRIPPSQPAGNKWEDGHGLIMGMEGGGSPRSDTNGPKPHTRTGRPTNNRNWDHHPLRLEGQARADNTSDGSPADAFTSTMPCTRSLNHEAQVRACPILTVNAAGNATLSWTRHSPHHTCSKTDPQKCYRSRPTGRCQAISSEPSTHTHETAATTIDGVRFKHASFRCGDV